MQNESKPEPYNPFASPARERPEAKQSPIPPKQDFHVVENKLYCKNNVDLSNICWLTGVQSADYRSRTLSSQTQSNESIVSSGLLAGLATLVLALWISGLRSTTVKVLLVLVNVLLILKAYGAFGGTKFQLKLGRSKTAISAEKFARRFLWSQIPIHTVFITAAAFFTESMLPFCVLSGMWIAGWLIANTKLNAQPFRAKVAKGDGDYFVVYNLQPKFLAAVQKLVEARQQEPPNSTKSVNSVVE